MSEPIFQNLPHSFTWTLKKNGPIHILVHPKYWPIHILLFEFLYPFCACCYTNITVNSCNTKRISSLEKSLSEKYVHIPGCQKNRAFHIGIQKNRAIHILFVEKRGPIIYLAALKKGTIRHAHPHPSYRCSVGPIESSTPIECLCVESLRSLKPGLKCLWMVLIDEIWMTMLLIRLPRDDLWLNFHRCHEFR